jgi:DNA-binding response OmpR family regulator
LLRGYGYWAQLASNELEALDALDETTFDLMILDTDTVGLDWANLVKLVRMSTLGLAPLPVIALTAGGDDVVAEVDGLAVEAVLTKPLSPEVLLQALTGLSAGKASSPGG